MAESRKFLTIALLVLTITNAIPQISGSLQCLSADKKPVDWFIVYKIPEISKVTNANIEGGVGFFYMDVVSPKWVLSEVPINASSHHAVYNTLQQIYANKTNSYMFASYNDHPPKSKEYMNYGHTKGVVAFDTVSGFWLVHSTPQFPPVQSDGYSWPSSAHVYGQTFLCISMDNKMLDTIGMQFMYTYPKVYDFYMATEMAAKCPNMAAVLYNHTHVANPPWFSGKPLVSLAGTKFESFAKFSNYGQEMYSAWIAPEYKSDLSTETWQNGRGKLPSNCTADYKVFNVQDIAFNLSSPIVKFKETKDHSKWAVSTNTGATKNVVCIGGINREEPQEHRAGGTVCTVNPDIWTELSSLIAQYENCPAQEYWEVMQQLGYRIILH